MELAIIHLPDLTEVALLDGVVKRSLFFVRKAGLSPQMPPSEVMAPENRRVVVEIGGNINGLPLPEEGNYEFVLLWNGQEIASRRLNAVKISLPPPENPDIDETGSNI